MLDGKDVLLTEQRGHILILTMNRQERHNALSYELMQRFDEELERFNNDSELWVMILTGAGEKAFCSGLDLKEFSERTARGEPRKPPPSMRGSHPVVPTWKPLIAAVNGYAFAGGWSMAQRCDLRIAAETASFGVPENRWNLAASFVGQPHLFPTGAIAAEVALMARPITAQRAYEIGFVNKVVPASQLMDEALSWAEHLCTLGQEAVRGHKKMLYYSRWVHPADVAGLGEDVFYWMGGGKPGVVVDSTIGSRAFAEGRQPDFNRMFDPPRLVCSSCHSEYVLAKEPGKRGPATCCGLELKARRSHDD